MGHRRLLIQATCLRLAAVGVIATCLAGPGVALAQPAPAGSAKKQPGPEDARRQQRIDEALSLHDEARDLYEKGDYRGAIERLERALALDPEGKELVYNLGLIHEKLGEIDAARRYYERYLGMESDPAMIERTQKALKRLEGAKSQLAREPTAPPAEPLRSPAGREGDRPAPELRRPIGTWVWIAGGVSASAFVVGNFFAVSALVKSPGDDAKTGGDVGVDDLKADAESAHRRAVFADISFAVALVAAGAAVYLYLSTPPERVGTSRMRRPTALSF